MARKLSLKLKILSAVAVGLIVLLLVLNPSESGHRNAVYDHMRRQSEKEGNMAGVALSTALKSFDAFHKAAPMRRTNYLLFSTAELELGVHRYKTIGVLGFVYVYK